MESQQDTATQMLLTTIVFALFVLPYENRAIRFLRVASIIVCVTTSAYGLTIPTYWAHIIPAVMLYCVGVFVLRNGFPVQASPTLSVTIALSAISLLAYEIKTTHLSSLHSLCHVFIFIPVATLAAASGFVAPTSRTRAVHDIAAYAMIGTILLYHRHDLRPIAMRWHQLMGGGLLVVAGLHVLYHVKQEEHGSVEFVRLLISWVYCTLSVFMVEMALCLYLLRDSQGRVVGFHDMWPEATDPYESLCLYAAIALGMGACLVNNQVLVSRRMVHLCNMKDKRLPYSRPDRNQEGGPDDNLEEC